MQHSSVVQVSSRCVNSQRSTPVTELLFSVVVLFFVLFFVWIFIFLLFFFYYFCQYELKEGNDAVNTFYLQLYCIRHKIKDHSAREETCCHHYMGYSI